MLTLLSVLPKLDLSHKSICSCWLSKALFSFFMATKCNHNAQWKSIFFPPEDTIKRIPLLFNTKGRFWGKVDWHRRGTCRHYTQIFSSICQMKNRNTCLQNSTWSKSMRPAQWTVCRNGTVVASCGRQLDGRKMLGFFGLSPQFCCHKISILYLPSDPLQISYMSCGWGRLHLYTTTE